MATLFDSGLYNLTTSRSETSTSLGGECKSQDEFECALIRRVQAGDNSAFEALIAPHRKNLSRTVLSMVRNSYDAEDIVQQCLLQIFVKLGQFRGDAKFSTWITRIAINHGLMYLRKQRRVFVPIHVSPAVDEECLGFDPPDPSRSPEDLCYALEVGISIHEQVKRPPVPMKRVFELLYFYGCSTEETSMILGLTVSATKSRALRARKHLQGRLAGFQRLESKQVL